MMIRAISQAGPDDARANLKRVMSERVEDYTGVSRLIGRTPGYLGRYVREGVPRTLGCDERDALARYFNVPVELFGGETPQDEPEPAFVKKPLRARD